MSFLADFLLLTHVGWHVDRCDELFTREKKKNGISMERSLATLLHLSGSLAVILTRARCTCGGSDAQGDVIS